MTLLALLSGSAILPAAGWASSSGGTSLRSGGGLDAGAGLGNPGGSGSSSLQPSPGRLQPANTSVQASGNGITITTRASALLNHQLHFTGSVPASAAGRTVEIERRGRQTGWTWAGTTHSTVQSDGTFTAVWPTNHIGRFSIRAIVLDGQGASGRTASASPTLTITIYRPSVATQYGPGFFGQRTACGQTLQRSTLGVANRTLKCGTPVSILWHGRTIVVPVIDRGPYANNADWDLTTATAQALGISGTATVGAVSLPR